MKPAKNFLPVSSLLKSNPDWLSLTFDEFGWIFMHPNNGTGNIQPHNGFAEMHLGPKVTFIRNDVSPTVLKALSTPNGGENVEVP